MIFRQFLQTKLPSILKSIVPSLLSLFLLGCGSSDSTTTPTQNTESSYQNLLSDAFTSQESSLWQKSDWANGDPFLNGWCPDQVSFNNGVLSLELTKLSCHERTHASGEYRSLATYMYGKYTTQFQISDVNGTISSFFLYTGPTEGTEWDEIDIEILGKDTTKIQINYWRNAQEHPVTLPLGFDASLAMHTYSFVWLPDSIEWFVDGQSIYKVYENNLQNNDSLPINAGKIMLNLWAATGIESWSGSYDENQSATTRYEYVTFDEYIQP